MKKFAKLAVALLPALVLAMALPGIACAKAVKLDAGTQVLYSNSFSGNTSVDSYYSDKWYGYGNKIHQKIKNAKSTNQDVATVEVEKYTDYNNKICYRMKVTAKKTGKTTIKWKQKGVTYKRKITVKSYSNPLEVLTVNGKNIAKKFNKTNVVTLDYDKWKNKEFTLDGNHYSSSDTSGIKIAGKNELTELRSVHDGECHWAPLAMGNIYYGKPKRGEYIHLVFNCSYTNENKLVRSDGRLPSMDLYIRFV